MAGVRTGGVCGRILVEKVVFEFVDGGGRGRIRGVACWERPKEA
jgi:hypothetical protein